MYSYTKLEICQYGVELILKKELAENIYQHKDYTKTTYSNTHWYTVQLHTCNVAWQTMKRE